MPLEIEVLCRVNYHDLERVFVATCEEYPECVGYGATPEKAAQILHSAITRWLNMLKSQALPFEKPYRARE